MITLTIFMTPQVAIVPLFNWFFSPVLSFASYPLHPIALGAGTVCSAWGIRLLYRSHADLAGTSRKRSRFERITSS